MTPSTVIRKAAAEGVRLKLSPPDNINIVGDESAVDRWIPVIRRYKPQIIEVLHEAASDLAPDNRQETFEFSPPGDPANDDEALLERVAIMMKSGMDGATALQEARWNAGRERCLHGFLRNAQRIQDAPSAQREELLTQYKMEATRRYGDPTGAYMADSLRARVTTKLQ